MRYLFSSLILILLCSAAISQPWYQGCWVGAAYKQAYDDRVPPDSLVRIVPKLICIDSAANCRSVAGEKNSRLIGRPLRADSASLVYERFSVVKNGGVVFYRANGVDVPLLQPDAQHRGYNIAGYLDYFLWQGHATWRMAEYKNGRVIGEKQVRVDNPWFRDSAGRPLWKYVCSGHAVETASGGKQYPITLIKSSGKKNLIYYYYLKIETDKIYIMNKTGALAYLLYR
jgi:hypothetical protein